MKQVCFYHYFNPFWSERNLEEKGSFVDWIDFHFYNSPEVFQKCCFCRNGQQEIKNMLQRDRVAFWLRRTKMAVTIAGTLIGTCCLFPYIMAGYQSQTIEEKKWSKFCLIFGGILPSALLTWVLTAQVANCIFKTNYLPVVPSWLYDII